MKHLLIVTLLMVGSLIGTRCSAQQDKIEAFAHGIAMTEGYFLKGTLPNRYHNPGDLKYMAKGEKYPGQVGIGKGGHIIFRNSAAGYSALYRQIDKMLTGESKYYKQEMTILQVGKLYAQNYRLWAKNLAKNLGVKPSTTLEEYFELPPRVVIKGKPYPIH
jgi:hypothetical protein